MRLCNDLLHQMFEQLFIEAVQPFRSVEKRLLHLAERIHRFVYHFVLCQPAPFSVKLRQSGADGIHAGGADIRVQQAIGPQSADLMAFFCCFRDGPVAGTFGIPEMGTNFVRGMLVEARPKNFSELIQISGLSHGTDVWTGNADELIRSGTCTIAEVIGCRDSIMLYLLRKGLEPKMAFDIMEAVRKGKVAKGGFQPGWEEAMREHEVPDWYIESCRKIKYMFPKAHAVAYLMSAIRLMWYKIYKPQAFYAVYFTVRGDDIDYEAAIGGAAVARAHMEAVKRRLKEEKNAKDEDVLVSLQLVNEMLSRGYEFLPIELGKSLGSKYVVEDDKVRLPFSALKGLGGAAADALERVTIHGEEYISVEELQQASGVGSSILDRLRQVGALGDLPESSQVSFF